MQQRRPRLGDVLDDYCPRERRITNHVIVAMIEDDVRQTRCTTCNADHDYKQARTPSPRRHKPVAAIHDGADAFEAKPVLTPPPRAVSEPAAVSDDAEPASSHESLEFEPAPPAPAPSAPMHAAADNRSGDEGSIGEPRSLDDAQPARSDDEEGPVHRRLIRAALPRPEGYVPERKEPEFTIRQPSGRGGGHEVDGNRAGYRQKGQRPPGAFGGGHSRFGGQRHGSGQPSQRPGGGRGPDGGQRGGRPDGPGNSSRGQRQGPGPGRRRGGR
jgi:hypothetical protein